MNDLDTLGPAQETPATGAASASASALADFAGWRQEVRALPSVESQDSRGPQFRRALARAVAPFFVIGGVGLAVFGGWSVLFPPTAVLSGRVCDVEGRPVMGARVFVPLSATPETITSAAGRFELHGVPTGRRSVIIVLEDLGQEYRAEDLRALEKRDLGDLTYSVPLLAERLARSADHRPRTP
jgi:hypothetical protein